MGALVEEKAFQVGTNCNVECQFEPKNAWYTQTRCCGCDGGSCPVCTCGSECSSQASVAWQFQTDCCGCKSSLEQYNKSTASKASEEKAFQAGPNCGIECQFEPQDAWYTQTRCCGCEGSTCPACTCGTGCSSQPSVAWQFQTECCGCKSPSFQQQNSSAVKLAVEEKAFQIGPNCGVEC